MTDPFAAALDALFYAPGSAAAVYMPLVGWPSTYPIRVIHGRPDGLTKHGRIVVMPASHSFEIRKSEITQPAIGDVVDLAGERFKISLEPLIDIEGLTWTCAAEPTP